MPKMRQLGKNKKRTNCEKVFPKQRKVSVFLIHFNIRCLQKHIDELNSVLASFKNQPEIVAISETKIIERKINRNIDLDGYNFIQCDSVTRAGGVGLYIKNTLAYKIHELALARTRLLTIFILTLKKVIKVRSAL